jgi:cysteinyl-tRNA synthetase
VYFSIERYREAGHTYGQLTNLNFDAMRPGQRVRTDEYEKESISDFALWKARVPGDGDVFWTSSWGEGRPGWHIECSAMSMHFLGNSFDLHVGGEDLVFPHHEDEIAQSEGADVQSPGKRFVKYWLHGAHLMVEGKKMSKSLNNFFTLRDLFARGFSAREVRYVLLLAHYRDSLNFTFDGLGGARSALGRLDQCLTILQQVAGDLRSEPDVSILNEFTSALDEDLNIAGAWGVVFEWVRETNRKLAAQTLSAADAAAAIAAWQRIDSVLGIGQDDEADVPIEICRLVEARRSAREVKDFKTADALRSELKSKGWAIEDTPDGQRLKHHP